MDVQRNVYVAELGAVGGGADIGVVKPGANLSALCVTRVTY